jgi:hypothetical protein
VLVLGSRTVGGVFTNRFYLARIDVRRNRADVVAPLPPEPHAFTCGAGSLWLGQTGTSTLERIDPNSGEVLERRTARIGTALAFAANRLWTAFPDGTVRRLGP